MHKLNLNEYSSDLTKREREFINADATPALHDCVRITKRRPLREIRRRNNKHITERKLAPNKPTALPI